MSDAPSTPPDQMALPCLSAAHISKSFAGVRALRDVSFDLLPGGVHALVGENGAGKSTLIKILTGAHQPDSGTLTVHGDTMTAMTPAHARALGIAPVYQHPALFPDLTVAENLGLALEPASPFRRIDWAARRTRAAALLTDLGSDIDPDAPVSTLSMPEQQIVEIAKAVGADASIVLLDEPTASLSDREVTRLFGIIDQLRSRGVALIYISHRLEEVFTIADWITVLRDGQTVASVDREATSMPEVVKLMVGRAIEPVEARPARPAGEVATASAAPALAIHDLSNADGTVHAVSLTLARGEILGLAGLVGSGRTELAETIFGLRRPSRGTVELDGRVVDVRSPKEAIALGLAYLPEDRLRHGIVAEMSVAANTSLASLEAVSRSGLVDRAREGDLAGRYVERFRIKTPTTDTDAGLLSGGNQQKVALARWLATSPTVLIVDEPTQGVDVGSKAEIHALLRELTTRGLAILMISSELPEVLALSDRITVMRAGTIAGTLDRTEATEERLLALALAVPHDAGPGSDHAAATSR